MRNLKRALSLALAFVMVMSMMVVGAGAVSIDDFSDKDEIVTTEAVVTMVSLGVINGKDPTLGSITANFTDTKGHWAESYIAYVSSLGIIDGRGDGTFGPNDQVTGAQAAKMILTMLGYRSDIEGFKGRRDRLRRGHLLRRCQQEGHRGRHRLRRFHRCSGDCQH